jgi:hypothetical protein
MKRTTLKLAAIALGMASVLCSTNSQGQSADALLDKLVEKGILTTKEANDLKREADQNFTKAYQVKSGMPDWVTSLKLNGDFRGRYEGFYSENSDFIQRDRFRYRLRFGAVATLLDNFEVGLRLSSGDPVGPANTGNPVSANSTLQDNGTRKFLFIDLAYAKWNALHSQTAGASFTLGKMENPFTFSQMVFDPDYNPEGLAAQLSFAINDSQAIKANLGGFVLDEFQYSTHDPFLVAGQISLESKWTKKLSTSIGGGMLGIRSAVTLTNNTVPNINRGNTRRPGATDGLGTLAYNFNPFVADASLTYTLDSFPCYKGAFPVKVLGEYLNNPATSTKNEAFMGGVVFGKAGKKGLWELSYQYRYLGADSWYEELADDDFGAFYQQQQPNAGFFGTGLNGLGAGYGGGTNVRGHVAKATYSLTDSLAFIVTYYNAILINETPAGSKSGMSHLLVDLMWRF